MAYKVLFGSSFLYKKTSANTILSEPLNSGHEYPISIKWSDFHKRWWNKMGSINNLLKE